MRRAFRRIGAVILVLCLLTSMMSVAVLAEDGSSLGGNLPGNGEPSGNGDAPDSGDTLEEGTEITGEIIYSASGYYGDYDGAAHSISVSVTSPEGASVSYAYPIDGAYGSQNPEFTSAGNYQVAYKIEKELYETKTGIETVAIERADVSEAVESTLPSSFTYDGNPVQFTPFHEGIETWEIDYRDADGASLSAAPSELGSYSVKIIGSGSNCYANVFHSFTIVEPEKEIDYRVDGFDVAYDGLPHSISLTVRTDGVSVRYATAYEGPYSETNPSFTETNTYVVYYRLEKQGYKSEEGSVTVEIHALDISEEVKATLPGSFTCTGAPVQFDLPTDKVQEWSVEYCQGDLSLESAPSAPGSYTATISGESGNYRASISHSFTIVEKEVIQYAVSGYNGYYDGTAHTIALNIATEGVSVTYATSEDGAYSATLPSFTEPGTYTVWFKLEKEDCETVTGSATVTITELGEIEYTVSGYSGYYDGEAHTIDLVAAEGVSVTYATSEDGAYSAMLPSFTEPGMYTVWFKLEKENYKTVTGSATVAIAELGEIEYTVSGYSGYYDGAAHTIDLVAAEGVSVTYATSEDGAYSATLPSFTEPGTYTVWFKLEKENCETVTGSATVTITELAQIDYTVQGYNGYYDGKAHTIALNIATEGVTATFASSEDSAYTATQPSFTEPGEYTVWFRLEKEGYETKYDFGVVEIRQADIEYSVKGYTGQYDGKPHSISLDVKTPGAAVTYATSRDGTYTDTMPGFSDPGTYTVWFKIEKNDHTSVLNSETVTIKPGQIHYTVSDYKGVYDGEGHSITLSVLTPGAKVTYSVENALALNLPTFSSDNPSFVDAGTFKVRYWIEKHGYETVNGSATVTIEKAEQKLYFEKSVNVLKLVDLDKLYAEFRFFCEQGAGVVTVSSSSGIIQALYQASDPSELSRYALYFSADVETPVTVTATAAETTNYKAATATCVFVRSSEIDAYFDTTSDATLNVRDAPFIGRNDGKKQTLKTEELDLTIRPLSDRDDKSLLGASLKLWKKLMDSVGASLIGSMAVDVALFDNQTGMEVHNVSGDLTLMLTGVLQQKYQENYKEMACYAVHIKQDSTTGSTAASTGTSTNGQGVNIDSQSFIRPGGTIDTSGSNADGSGVYAGSSGFTMDGGNIDTTTTGTSGSTAVSQDTNGSNTTTGTSGSTAASQDTDGSNTNAADNALEVNIGLGLNGTGNNSRVYESYLRIQDDLRNPAGLGDDSSASSNEGQLLVSTHNDLTVVPTGSFSPTVEYIPCELTERGVRIPDTSLSPFLLIYGPKEAFSNLLTVRAKDGVFTYDGEDHAVAAEPSIVEGTTLYYSLDLESWQTEAPSFTDVLWNEDGSVGSYQVYVLAENPDCDPAVCSYTVTIDIH